MPAQCASRVYGNPCGVVAIGRCAACGDAFCLTHQGLSSDYRPLINQCSSCSERARSDDRDFELRNGSSYMQDSAKRELQAAGCLSQTLFVERREWEQKFFRKELVTHFDVCATGWLLGSHQWEYLDGSDSTGIYRQGNFITALIDRDQGIPSFYNRIDLLYRVTQVSGKYVLDTRTGSFKGNMYALSEAVHTMVDAASA